MDDGADAAAAGLGWQMQPSRRRVVGAVGRRLVPYLVEATLIPTAIFYAVLATTGELRWALLGALVWSYAAVGRRFFGRRAIPGLLILATLGISVRAGIYLWNNNSFVYFVQPILRTVLTAGLFAGSVVAKRPLIARFADDFCPLAPDVQSRPAVLSLFRRLTLLWAGANGLMAMTSLALLVTVPVPVFVVSATVSAWLVTGTGVVVTVVDAMRTARREGLVTALAPNGALYAATTHPVLT